MNSYAFVRDPAVKVCLLRLEGPDFGAYNDVDVRQYKEMHQLLKEKKIKTVPKTLDELLELEAPGKAVYILPTFRDDCPIFKHLLSIKAKIYGTLAVTECVRADAPLPSQTPLLGLTLRGAVVCFTGIDIATREKKARIVHQLGGTVAKDLSRSVTHLVASTAEPKAPKYAAATKTRLPVLTPAWIDDAWQSALCYNPVRYTERDHYQPAYAMPIFHNLEISATGYGHERPEIMRLIQLHGGTFNGAMSKTKCTHLLAEKNSGEKFQKATEWGLHVVRLEWLKKSIQMGYRLPEEKFAHNRALDTSNFSSPNVFAEPSSSSELVANNTHATPKPTPKRPNAFPKQAEPVAKPMPPAQRIVPLQKITSMRRSMSMRSLTEAPAAVPDPIEGVDVAKCKMSDCLEGCHLYLCGYTDSALPKYKTLVRKVGATLSYEQLDAQVTHILVGTAPFDPQTTEMLKNPPGDVPVLTTRWLLDCATHPDKPRRLDIDAYLHEAQTKRAEDAPVADAGFKKPLNARNVEDLSSVQKNRPTGGTLGSVGGAGTQTVPETQAWRPAKSSIFQRQSSTVGAAENENTVQPTSRITTATNVADPGYPSAVASSDTMTTASNTGNAWTEVPTIGGRTTASNTLTLGLNRETTTPQRMDCSDPSTEVRTLGGQTSASSTVTLGHNQEKTTPQRMDCSDPTLSTSNANEQTPKQSTPLAMNNRVAMLRFSECGSRRSSIGSPLNATADSMNLSHSPTEYLTGKFPFKLRLKHLSEAEQHIRDMPTPQGSPRTSTESLMSVSAVGRLLAQAVVNTGRGLEQRAVAQGPDNDDQMEVDAGVNNGNEEAEDDASTVTAEELVAVAEPASPSRNRRPPNRFQNSPVKENALTPKKRIRTPKKTPKSPAREKPASPSPNTDQLDNDEQEATEAASTVSAAEPVVAAEPASSSRKRVRAPKKTERSPTEEDSPEANPKPKRQRATRKKQL